MKIQRLHLDGFGRWSDASFEFAPGLNVIYGANQAGKSTMQQALLAMRFCGAPPTQPTGRMLSPLAR